MVLVYSKRRDGRRASTMTNSSTFSTKSEKGKIQRTFMNTTHLVGTKRRRRYLRKKKRAMRRSLLPHHSPHLRPPPSHALDEPLELTMPTLKLAVSCSTGVLSLLAVSSNSHSSAPMGPSSQ